MQVNNGPKKLEENMEVGIAMLRSLYLQLGSIKAAVMAYNIGIGNYLKGKLRISGNKYYSKFNSQRGLYETYVAQHSTAISDTGSEPVLYDMQVFFGSGTESSFLTEVDSTAYELEGQEGFDSKPQ